MNKMIELVLVGGDGYEEFHNQVKSYDGQIFGPGEKNPVPAKIKQFIIEGKLHVHSKHKMPVPGLIAMLVQRYQVPLESVIITAQNWIQLVVVMKSDNELVCPHFCPIYLNSDRIR